MVLRQTVQQFIFSSIHPYYQVAKAIHSTLYTFVVIIWLSFTLGSIGAEAFNALQPASLLLVLDIQ